MRMEMILRLGNLSHMDGEHHGREVQDAVMRERGL